MENGDYKMFNSARSIPLKVRMVIVTMMSDPRPAELSSDNDASNFVALFIRARGTCLVPA